MPRDQLRVAFPRFRVPPLRLKRLHRRGGGAVRFTRRGERWRWPCHGIRRVRPAVYRTGRFRAVHLIIWAAPGYRSAGLMSRGRASCRIPCVSRILVIDDDQGVRETVQRMLRAAGYTVQTAESGEDGLALARGGAFDVILSDMRMPGISGIEVLRRLRERRVDTAFIVMTAFGTVDTAVEAMKLGAVDFVQKPFFRDELLMRVLAAADRRQLARQVDLLQRQIGGSDTLAALVGESEPMQRLKALIARAAAANGTVLITGETGTGKELVARAIHTESPRAARPFVALNCAALSDSLLENELFGHARGAFTGAPAA